MTTLTSTIARPATLPWNGRTLLWTLSAALLALGTAACGEVLQPADLDGRLTLSPERPAMYGAAAQPAEVVVTAEPVAGPRAVAASPGELAELLALPADPTGPRLSPVRPAEAFIDEYCDETGECFTVIDAPIVLGATVSGPRPSWTWSVPAGAESFLLRLDESDAWMAVPATVTSYASSRDLTAGLHTFEIASVDSDGNLSELARFTTRVLQPLGPRPLDRPGLSTRN